MQQVLTKNNFTFMDKHYLQRHGTAMGTRMAPSFACLFMSSLEERMLSTAPCRPLIWWRYIDDIFFFGPVMRIACSPSSITSILSTAPSNSPLITLTNRCFGKTPYCQGHSARRVREAIQRVRSLSRSSTLAVKDKKGRDCDNKLPLVVTFHPNLPPLQKITSNNHNILLTSDRLQRAVPEKPIIAYRRPRNLRDLLVRAAVPPLTSNPTPIQHGTFKCDRTSRCIVCSHHIVESNSITSHSMQLTHKTKGHITCTTTNVIYLISCRVCGIQYKQNHPQEAILWSQIHSQHHED
ncbi:hypothetical protein BSL78_13997 [Apostichopus japonicus]|uniref:Reverse transcriptase domain-containing protein n=1 Tax=Stichopus japonicus TaxID=307972 RepID=A0A2G8KMG2_STIJA|nr:hypothetical protein BSL78_13997 [Apostichopus japonicus]